MQSSITLHLSVTEEGVSSAIDVSTGGPYARSQNIVAAPFLSPALAAEAASVIQEVVEFAEYISSTGSES